MPKCLMAAARRFEADAAVKRAQEWDRGLRVLGGFGRVARMYDLPPVAPLSYDPGYERRSYPGVDIDAIHLKD